MPNQPANPRAMPASRALLGQLYALWGTWTLSGQANRLGGLARDSGRVNDISHEWPAVWAADFGYSADRGDDNYIGDRDGLLDEAARQSQAGSLVQLDWRPDNPVIGEPCQFQSGLVERISDRDWEAMLTPGTSVHTRWLTQMDIVGVFLRYLKEAGIPVLFRPCPAMNGRRWWWGGRPGPAGYAGLWRSVWDHLVRDQRLDNLLLVWTPEAGLAGADPAGFYPGHDMVDILGAELHAAEAGGDEDACLPRGDWDRLRKLADGRPLALAGSDLLPGNELLERQRWLWFTLDGASWEANHRPEDLRVRYAGDYLLHRRDWRQPHQAR